MGLLSLVARGVQFPLWTAVAHAQHLPPLEAASMAAVVEHEGKGLLAPCSKRHGRGQLLTPALIEAQCPPLRPLLLQVIFGDGLICANIHNCWGNQSMAHAYNQTTS